MDLHWAISKLTINKITNAFRKIIFVLFSHAFLILISKDNYGLSLLGHQLPTTTLYNTL
jgi:hypothetical protein